MGRWGHRVFESDVDLDICCELDQFSGVKLFCLVYQSDMLAPQESRQYYTTEEYRNTDLPNSIMEAREQLDSRIGFRKFDELLHKANEQETSGQQSWDREAKYKLLIFGALMMRCGAKVTDTQRAFMLRELSRIPAHDSYRLPLFDEGFRLPGMLQFKAALENYNDGISRSFEEPR
jgi:hypothetical protein